MKVVKTVKEVREIVSAWKKEGLSVGLVPTMGFLHEGHQSLIRKSASQNDRTVVSVFVNPIQFGPNEDLEAYPRDLNRDMQKVEEAVRNAGRIMKETNCQAVKLEGGVEYADRIKAIVQAGIPVVAHIGLTPQSFNALGGYKVQGKSLQQAQKLIQDAEAVAEAGAFAITLECVPAPLAKLITEQTDALTIGIGAGNGCDGQVLVYQDMLGFTGGFVPKFVKQYADLHSVMLEAFKQYKEDCASRAFPEASQTYAISDEVMQALFEVEEVRR